MAVIRQGYDRDVGYGALTHAGWCVIRENNSDSRSDLWFSRVHIRFTFTLATDTLFIFVFLSSNFTVSGACANRFVKYPVRLQTNYPRSVILGFGQTLPTQPQILGFGQTH